MKTKVKDNGSIPDLVSERAARKGSIKGKEVQIAAPNMQVAEFKITGTAPYMQARFSKKAMDAMRSTQESGSRSAKGKKRAPRDFEADYQGAMHKAEGGWCGIPAGAFRNAMISACRLCGFKMTLAKLSLFVIADGIDAVDGTPLVKLVGKPEKTEMPARNANGNVDIRVRPMWREWSAMVRIQFDADQLSLDDITNLLMRVGLQVGLGEGRPDSRASAGMGFGLFAIQGSK